MTTTAAAKRRIIAAASAVAATLLAAAPASSAVPAPPAPSAEAEMTKEEIAAVIYAQARGLGLGDTGAAVAIGIGLAESGLVNDTEGDCWYGDCSKGRTSSRGVFQQFYSWPPLDLAWSGTSYGPRTGSAGTDFSGFNSSNAYGPAGWAVSDPRMDVAQAASMALLGPQFNPKGGVEDVKLFKRLRTKPLSEVSNRQLAVIAQAVQQFPFAHLGSYAKAMAPARDYVAKFSAGEVDVPGFTMPLDAIADMATTAPTRKALKEHRR